MRHLDRPLINSLERLLFFPTRGINKIVKRVFRDTKRDRLKVNVLTSSVMTEGIQVSLSLCVISRSQSGMLKRERVCVCFVQSINIFLHIIFLNQSSAVLFSAWPTHCSLCLIYLTLLILSRAAAIENRQIKALFFFFFPFPSFFPFFMDSVYRKGCLQLRSEGVFIFASLQRI